MPDLEDHKFAYKPLVSMEKLVSHPTLGEIPDSMDPRAEGLTPEMRMFRLLNLSMRENAIRRVRSVDPQLEAAQIQRMNAWDRALSSEVVQHGAAWTRNGPGIFDIVEAVHKNSVDHGWWDAQLDRETGKVSPVLAIPMIPEKIALIHSEASEALEAYRDGHIHTTVRADGKPEGLGSELADVVIRCFDLAGALRVDIGTEILHKHRFNVTRPHRHGGKAC